MYQLTQPIVNKIHDRKIIIDLGDREVIVTKLLNIQGMGGFTACEKLKDKVGKPDERSFYPQFPQIINDCSMLVPSFSWCIDFVAEGFKRWARKNKDRPTSVRGSTNHLSDEIIERRKNKQLKILKERAEGYLKTMKKGERYPLQELPFKDSLHKSLKGLDYLVENGLIQTEKVNRLRYFWVV